jgi:hypothetical protein
MRRAFSKLRYGGASSESDSVGRILLRGTTSKYSLLESQIRGLALSTNNNNNNNNNNNISIVSKGMTVRFTTTTTATMTIITTSNITTDIGVTMNIFKS